jgi:hypothetical protein
MAEGTGTVAWELMTGIISRRRQAVRRDGTPGRVSPSERRRAAKA